MPKKQPKNAFFFFMLYFREQEAKRGRHYRTLPDVSPFASEPWQKMNAQERGPFEKKAKEARLGPQKEVEKFTSQGVPLSIIDKQEKEKEDANKRMKRTIKEIVDNGFTNNCIGSHVFYLISGNYFIKKDDNYFPAEIAMLKFSFEDGIINQFHTYVNPEKLPMGFAYDAKEHSETTHRLPSPPDAKGEKDYVKILDAIHRFMGNPSELPPMFTFKEEVPMIESFFREFCFRYTDDDIIDRYRVYPLHEILFEIKEEAVKNSLNGTSFKSVHIAEAHLNRDEFSYKPTKACNYHEDVDCKKHCALAKVQKWVYVLFVQICSDLNIDNNTLKHFPYGNSNPKENDDTKNANRTETKSRQPRAIAGPSRLASQWGPRPKSPEQDCDSSLNEDFPSLGSRRGGGAKKRSIPSTTSNPWNTSSSSSGGSNPLSDLRDMTLENVPSSGPWLGRSSFHDDSSFDTTLSRGMGRGSALFRNELHFGRGRSHNDSRRDGRGHIHHDRSERYHPWRSNKSGRR